MTTAARPTFEPAKGGMGRGERDLSALSKQYSARDLPSHTRLKYREHGRATADEVRNRDFRRELEERERAVASTDKRRSSASSSSRNETTTSSSTKRPRLDQIPPSNLDADDPQDDDEDADDASSGSDDDDDSALYAELERIRRERAEEDARRERERAEHEERIRMENIISGNPLLTLGGVAKTDMKVRRRWDDDVVFKNCGGASDVPKGDKRAFINDSLRSEFHKRFMEKYIK